MMRDQLHVPRARKYPKSIGASRLTELISVLALVREAPGFIPTGRSACLDLQYAHYNAWQRTSRTGPRHMQRKCRRIPGWASFLAAAPPDTGEDGGQQQGKTKGIYGFDQEVVEREAAEAPFRKIRLVSYGVLSFAAVILGGISIAGLAGVEGVRELGQNLPNPLLDGAVLGLAFYLWVEEVKAKRSALILMRKRMEIESRVPNRAERRQNKKTSKKEGRVPRQMAPSAASKVRVRPSDDVQRAQGAKDDAPRTEGMAVDEARADQGIFAGVRKTLEAVNQQSYYQALALNQELEDKGVLSRLERKEELPIVDAKKERNVESVSGPGDEVAPSGANESESQIRGSGDEQEIASGAAASTRKKRKMARKTKRNS